MIFSDIVIYILIFFMGLGAIDRILGNKFGLGKKFEEGFITMGFIALALIGIFCLAPVIALILRPIIVPIYSFLGADPSMFATTFIANDMGGYSLAMSLANDPQAGLFAGLILGSMLGATIVFSIPVALGIINKKDHKFLALGTLIGLITIPIGCIVGGLVAGFNIIMILKNLVPVIIISLLIILGIWKAQEKTLKGFIWFGKAILIIGTIGIFFSVLQGLTGISIIPGMAPISDAIKVVGSITIILIGAFPMVFILTKILEKPLKKFSEKRGIKSTTVVGMLTSLVNNIPMFGLIKDMDDKGKVINFAFMVGAAFVLGDHLGFTAAINRDMILPVILGKLSAGITAVFLAIYVYSKKKI